jgi:predicted house-cleaning noncanonical NTP pyrophosphatase (MazG superfamily)
MKKYNKLVRDLIPEIIEKAGKNFSISKIKGKKELKLYVEEKIIEEVNELLESKTRKERIKEFADVYEILEKYLEINKISQNEVKNARKIKNKKSGAFSKNLILNWTKEK